jgi:gamma-glutamyl:cysteine ligase YbdK (ATP-grasp superfamily)
LGQEIESAHFTPEDFRRFRDRLELETQELAHLFESGGLAAGPPTAGFELEAWLIDEDDHPAPLNDQFLERFDNPLASPELARFNVELNNVPHPLSGSNLSRLERELTETWRQACDSAEALGARLGLIGILPTLRSEDLGLHNMSDMNRYRALNDQVLRLRAGAPLRLNIAGRETLHSEHGDVMLESATTSFQVHLRVTPDEAHHVYNASMIASAPLVAASANSPYLFGYDLWDETRIPVFEQAVEVGGYADAVHGPVRRVSFGTGYARKTILECFRENLNHFPVLLPMRFEPSHRFEHLRLHNGTIWRWNRPLLGFDDDGTPHLRIEHRVVPSGPSLTDSIANAAFFYGLASQISAELAEGRELIPFTVARDNFYQAARYGLKATVTWGERRIGMRELVLNELLARARTGLAALGVDAEDSAHYLGLMRERVESQQNGACWQRRWVETYGKDWRGLTERYLELQRADRPIHEWPV